MSESEWIKVFATDKMHKALLIQSILKEHQIDSVLLNQQDSSYITFGEISIMVSLEHAADAMIIIEKDFL